MNGDSALASVVVQYKGRYVSKFTLNTSYFILNRYGTPVTNYQKSVARLCLLSVKQTGVDLKQDMNPYIFDYYTGSNNPDDFVPPPFFYAKDIWGYYNGNNSVAADNAALPLNKSSTDLNNSQIQGLCFLKNNGSSALYTVKPGYAKNGLLRQIIYPAGGSLTYTYDQNMGTVGGQYQNFGGVHVSQTSVVDGGFSNDCNNPLITQYKYLLDGDLQSSLWGVETPVNNTQSQTFYNQEDRQWKWLPPGCKWKYQWPGIQASEDKISLSDWQNFMVAATTVLGAVSTVMEIKDFVLLFTAAPSVLSIAAVIVDIGLIVWECTQGSSAKTYTSTVYYNCDLNGANPLPSQFKRVEVIPQSGNVGKTVYYFTSDNQVSVWAPSNPNFSMKQRYASWVYGLPLLVSMYDKNGNKVKETEYAYSGGVSSQLPITMMATTLATSLLESVTPQPAPDPVYHPPVVARAINIQKTQIPVDTPCVTCYVTKMRSQRNTDWSNPNLFNNLSTYSTANYSNNNGVMNVEFYSLYTGHLELDTVYEREYNSTILGVNYLQSVTTYQYNPNNLQIKDVRTTQSNGDITEKRIDYSCDYTEGDVFSTMNQQNMLSVVVSENTYLTNASFSAAPLMLLSNNFVQLGNGDIKPSSISTTKYLKPGTGTGSFYNMQTMEYDNAGNLIGVKDQESGRSVANIYDYDDKFVTATVINADAATDKPAYTGFETGVTGGWSLSSSPVFTTQAFTGTRALQLTTSLSASINAAQQYTLSFWATGTLSVAGGSLSKSGPTLNGFTYYEYLVQNTATVSVSGSAVIDELRLYPKAARMKTVAYDPIIGKISECDENNKVTYYEYDNLGRLNLIRDEQKNVIKAYTYNTSPNQQGCPTIYYNKAISETIAANNCLGNSIGNQITYTIAAAKYSSTISQADADSKAEQEINSLGQTQANSAGCAAIYYNAVKTGVFTRDDCQDGYKGLGITYTVPAGRYSSLISQAAADSMATDDLNANGDAFANAPENSGGCVIDTAGIWDGDSAQTQCNAAGHKLIYMTNKNPNSPTFNTSQWIDVGADSACPVVNSTVNIIPYITNHISTTSYTYVFLENNGNSTLGSGYNSGQTQVVHGGASRLSFNIVPDNNASITIQFIGSHPNTVKISNYPTVITATMTVVNNTVTFTGVKLNQASSINFDLN